MLPKDAKISEKKHFHYCFTSKKIPRKLFSDDSRNIHTKKLLLAQSYELIFDSKV